MSDSAEDGGELERRRADAAFADAGVLYFFQVGRSPVEHGVTGDIDEEVSKGEEPEIAVLEDVVRQQIAGAEFLLAVFARCRQDSRCATPRWAEDRPIAACRGAG